MVRITAAPNVMLRTVADSMINLIYGCCFSYNINEFYKNLPKDLAIDRYHLPLYVDRDAIHTQRLLLKIERDRLSKTGILFGTLRMWNVSTPQI